jgi:ribosomal-protein-alanine N-acetyltransferase
LRRIQTAALSDPWPELLELSLGEPSLVLVRETDDPVGYALVVPDGDVAYLAELAVAPAHQGVGHGTALMEALLERLADDGVETVRLTARADDERVHEFYRQFGFAVVDEVPDHYDDADGLLFERD